MSEILLLHGAIGASDQLEPLGELLLSRYHVHHLDFTGHGKRSGEPGFGMDQFVQDLHDCLNAIGKPLHVFGYSMGGYVALLHEASYAGMITEITTLGTKFDWTEESAAKDAGMLNPEVLEEKIPHFARALAERHGPEWKSVLRKTAAMMHELGDNNVIDQVHREHIDIPLNFGLADQDNMVSVDETDDMAARLGANRFTVTSSKHPIEQVDIHQLAQVLCEG